MRGESRCCHVCRSIPGVCRDKYECWCHLQANAESDRAKSANWRADHADPTANQAIGNVDRERRNRERRR